MAVKRHFEIEIDGRPLRYKAGAYSLTAGRVVRFASLRDIERWLTFNQPRKPHVVVAVDGACREAVAPL